MSAPGQPIIPDDPDEFAEKMRTVAGNLHDRAEFMEDLADRLEAGEVDVDAAQDELVEELRGTPTV